MPVAASILWKPLRDPHYVLASLQAGGGGRRELFVSQRVLSTIQGLIRSTSGDVLGLLLGHRFDCPLSGTKYVIIDGQTEVPSSGDDASSVRDALAKACARINGRGAPELLGWYSASWTIDGRMSEAQASIHFASFSQPWQTALLVGGSGDSGAFFLYDGLEARWFRAPFYELTESKGGRLAAKPTCVSWLEYITSDSVRVLPPVESIAVPAGAALTPAQGAARRKSALTRAREASSQLVASVVAPRATKLRLTAASSAKALAKRASTTVRVSADRITRIRAARVARAEERRAADRELARLRSEQQAAELEARREAARLAREREAARVAAKREAERVLAEQEAARKLAQREAAQLRAKQEAERKAAEREAARLRAEQEAAARALAEREAAQLRAKQEAARKAADEEAARARAEQEAAARVVAEREAARIREERKAARELAERKEEQRRAEQEAVRRAAEQEAARVRAEQEAAEQEAARLRAEQKAARALAEREAADRLVQQRAARKAAEQEAARVQAEQRALREFEEREAERVQAEQEAELRATAEREVARLRAELDAVTRSAADRAARLRAEQPEPSALADLKRATQNAVADLEDTTPFDSPYRYLALARREGFVVSENREDATSEITETFWRLNEPASGLVLTVITSDEDVREAHLHYNLHVDDEAVLRATSPEHRDLSSGTIYVREGCIENLRARCRRLRATKPLEPEWKVMPPGLRARSQASSDSGPAYTGPRA
jgi:hypothetical protein